MRKFSLGLVSGLLVGLLLSGSIALAGSPIKLIINGKQVVCDSPPQIINGRVMVPARNVAESLGATVQWDAANQSVIINSAQTSKDTEREEFLKISAEADALIAKYEVRLEGSISESESDNITSDIKEITLRFVRWGEMPQYTQIKSIYTKTLANLNLACVSKSFVNDKYVGEKARSDLKTHTESFSINKNSLNAEKDRLKKMGYL